MDEAEVFEKVKDITVECLGVNEENVTRETSFMDDLGADSFDAIELALAFEDEFAIKISRINEKKLRTVGDVVDFILRYKEDAK